MLFRGRQFHKLGGYHPFAGLLQVLIASFTKILSAVSAQAESEQTGGTKHGYLVVAVAAATPHTNCAADSPPDESVRRRTRLPLQLFQFFVYLGERVNGEFQVFPRMRGGDLRADACGAMWNNWIKETDHVNTLLQHARSELL